MDGVALDRASSQGMQIDPVEFEAVIVAAGRGQRGGGDVDQAGRIAALPAVETAGLPRASGSARRRRSCVCRSTHAQVFAVIGREQDQGVLELAGPLQGIEQAADLISTKLMQA